MWLLIPRGKGHQIQNLKTDFKVKILMFGGSIDMEKVDKWIEHLELYLLSVIIHLRRSLRVQEMKLSKCFRLHLEVR